MQSVSQSLNKNECSEKKSITAKKTNKQERNKNANSHSQWFSIYICHFYLYHKRIYSFILMCLIYQVCVCALQLVWMLLPLTVDTKKAAEEEKRPNSRAHYIFAFCINILIIWNRIHTRTKYYYSFIYLFTCNRLNFCARALDGVNIFIVLRSAVLLLLFHFCAGTVQLLCMRVRWIAFLLFLSLFCVCVGWINVFPSQNYIINWAQFNN